VQTFLGSYPTDHRLSVMTLLFLMILNDTFEENAEEHARNMIIRV
jgi:hypothetical protein